MSKKKKKKSEKKRFARYTDVLMYVENNFYDSNFCEIYASQKEGAKEALDCLYELLYNYQDAKTEIKRLNSIIYEYEKRLGIRNE